MSADRSAGSRALGRPIKILLVEDGPTDTELTVQALRQAELRNHVSLVDNREDALRSLRQLLYHQAGRHRAVYQGDVVSRGVLAERCVPAGAACWVGSRDGTNAERC